MRVCITRGVVVDGNPCRPGQTVEVGEAMGLALIRSGRAALISSPSGGPPAGAGGRETATAPPYQTAIAPAGIIARRGLTDISGIGVETVATLAEAGIVSFAELAAADPSELAKLKGISLRQAKNWVADALGMESGRAVER